MKQAKLYAVVYYYRTMYAPRRSDQYGRIFTTIFAIAPSKREARRLAMKRGAAPNMKNTVVVPTSVVPYLHGMGHDDLTRYYDREMGGRSRPRQKVAGDYNLNQYTNSVK